MQSYASASEQFPLAAYIPGMTNFDQSKHPRNSAGTSKGGQFAEKQNSAPEAALTSEDALGWQAQAIFDRCRDVVSRHRDVERQAILDQARTFAIATRDICRLFTPDAVKVKYRWSDDETDFLVFQGVYDADGNHISEGQFDDEMCDLAPFSHESDTAFVKEQPWMKFDVDSVTIDLTKLDADN